MEQKPQAPTVKPWTSRDLRNAVAVWMAMDAERQQRRRLVVELPTPEKEGC